MELRMSGFCDLSKNEMEMIDGGGITAFVFAMGFVFSCTPLAVCVVAGSAVVALGSGIYIGCNN